MSPTSTGIRDLDSSLRLTATKATEKEGYLYTPAPNFHINFCSIHNGRLSIVRIEDNKASSVDLMLCTVKENRDSKLRYVFNVINPMETITLQAESAIEMNDWMAVIQNAIGLQLNSNNIGNNKSPNRDSAHKRQFSQPNSAQNNDNPLQAVAAGQSLDANMLSNARPAGLPFSSMCDRMDKGEALLALKSVKGNEICVECDTENPDWVSLNLGIVICMECSGVHRSLGVHISKVRSTTLDKLDSYMVQYMCSVGNINSKQLWEAACIQNPKLQSLRATPQSTRPIREQWIRGKYELKSFLGNNVEKNIDILHEMMFTAVENGDLMLLLQSITWGASVNWENPDQENRSALHQAVMYGSPILVECCIQHSLELNTKELRGWTPLHYAAYQDDLALVELLLLRGGSALAIETDNDGRHPLASAMHHGGTSDYV